jgi:hypothetical protein
MIERLYFHRCAVLAAALAANFGYSETRAATMITDFNSPMTENFDTFDGTAGTIPADFTWAPDAGTTAGGIRNTAVDPYSNNNRWYAFAFSPSPTPPTDFAFGTKRQPTGVPAILTWSFVNQTGTDISEFEVAWDVEQYTRGNRLTTIDFDYDPNGAGPTQAGITGTTSTVATIGSTVGENLPSPIITPRSVSIALATPLANGQSIDFRWLTISGATISNQNAGIGVDNLSVTAIPEPSTICIGGLLLAIAGSTRVLGRRRQSS